MKVLGINGSPRPKSNTEFYTQLTLDELQKHGFETELINLRDKNVKPCTGCYGCVEAKKCVIKDDDFEEIFNKVVEADGLLLGSPVYNGSITANLKAFIDRAGFSGRWAANDMQSKSSNYDWKGTAFSGKVAAPITVARRTGQTFAFAQLLLWLTVNDFIVTGSNYWNVGTAGKGGAVDADEDAEGASIMVHLAENMANVIKKLKA